MNSGWQTLGRLARQHLCSAALAFLSAAGGQAGAAELRLGDTPYANTVIDQDLRQTIEEFGANTGTRVTMSDAVHGRVRGRLPALAPQAFLDRLASLYGFDWYYDGYQLYLTATTEALTRIIPLGHLSFAALRDALSGLGVLDSRFVLREDPSRNIALVAGPPRYVVLVQDTAAALEAGRTPEAPRPAAASAAREPAPSPLPRERATSLIIFRGNASQQVTFGH